MEPISFYYMPESPPCRAVWMTSRHLGLKMEMMYINLQNGDHLKPDFSKINPLKIVPTINDNGFILWESRAIMTYLVNKYAPDSSLYPENAKSRAVVDMMLNFDIGTLYKSESAFLRPIIFQKAQDPQLEEPFRDALSFLDNQLKKNAYVCGHNLTLADLSILASLSFAEASEYEMNDYPNILKWKNNLKTGLDYYKEVNDEAMINFTGFMRKCKSTIRDKIIK